MNFKLKGSITFSALGLFFLFFVLLMGFQQEYEKEVKGYITLKNYYLARSLSEYSSGSYHEKDGETLFRYFKNGEVKLTKVRQRVKIDVTISDDVFIFMKNLEDLPQYKKEEVEKED